MGTAARQVGRRAGRSFMDFMKIIESLDEALYTVMGWLVVEFYSR